MTHETLPAKNQHALGPLRAFLFTCKGRAVRTLLAHAAWEARERYAVECGYACWYDMLGTEDESKMMEVL